MILQHNFTNRYDGNRAPLGLFLHADWLLDAAKRNALNDFLTWAQTGHADVWLVSMSALVKFMRSPRNAAAAHTFPPFITTARALPPESSLASCDYPDASFRTSSQCPLVYPRPDTMYSTAVSMPGGTVSASVLNLYSTTYWARIVVSNNTSESAVDWEASFNISGGTVTNVPDGTWQTNGTRVKVHPDGWMMPLGTGRVSVVEFGGRRTGPVSFTSQSVALYGLGQQRPEILELRPGAGSSLIMRWDDSAFGYHVEQSALLNPDHWTAVSEVHGTTCWTNAAPERSGFLRVRAAP
jgi:hypothetical protein